MTSMPAQSPRLGSRPLALVLPGGAAFGAWQSGCLYGLVRSGVGFHSVFGTSIGALNGCAYFQDTLEFTDKLWRKVKGSDFFKIRPTLNPPSLFSHHHLRQYLDQYVDEERARRLKRCWFYVISADIQSGHTHQATFSPEPGGEWDGPLLDNLLGSISIPFLLPPVKVKIGESEEHRLLLDGNAKAYVNVFPALERGAKDVLYLSVLHPDMVSKPKLGPLDYVGTLINQLLQGQVNHSLDFLRSHPTRGVRAYVAHPSRPLTLNSISFNTEQCRNAYDLGVEDAKLILADPEAYRVL